MKLRVVSNDGTGSQDSKGSIPVEVDADHGQVSPARASGVTGSHSSGRISLEDISSDIPHGDGADKGTVDQAIASADLLYQIQGEEDHAKGLCDAVEAGCEELRRCAGNTKSLEDSWRVICDDVCRC